MHNYLNIHTYIVIMCGSTSRSQNERNCDEGIEGITALWPLKILETEMFHYVIGALLLTAP